MTRTVTGASVTVTVAGWSSEGMSGYLNGVVCVCVCKEFVPDVLGGKRWSPV